MNYETKLINILKQNDIIMTILKKLYDHGYTDFYMTSGAINQTVFNYLENKPLNNMIKDYDIVYFDKDTRYESEDKVIKEITKLLNDLNVKLDIKNEARVPLWFKDKFGYDMVPYKNIFDAIGSFAYTTACIGCKFNGHSIEIYAPYGLEDLFNREIRPVKKTFNKDAYNKRSNDIKTRWPSLNIQNYD